VAPRKDGTTVYYTLRDPLLDDLLDVARKIFNTHLVGTQDLLRELERERKAR
jgi:ArsR family transcriptional regulator